MVVLLGDSSTLAKFEYWEATTLIAGWVSAQPPPSASDRVHRTVAVRSMLPVALAQ